MHFGQRIRELRQQRHMTLRELGEAAGMDYVLLNKIELGLRMPPPLETIIALADALSSRKKLTDAEFERLLDLAAQKNDKAEARFTTDVVARFKRSQTVQTFFTRRERKEQD
jgi:transcriptional regulator with XRE-family HTH domain